MTIMLSRLALILTLFTCCAWAAEWPNCTVDYQQPNTYVALCPSLGNPAVIQAAANRLRTATPSFTLRAILHELDGYAYEPNLAYAWRNAETVLTSKTTASCADHGLTAVALLRAVGIPAIVVKSLDIDWMWKYRRTQGQVSSWTGHVFAEIYLDGMWMLLDPQAGRLYRDYNPLQRLLPDGKYAYHKGLDPQRMVMSLQWNEWLTQTKLFMKYFNYKSLPPESGGQQLLSTLVIGNSPAYQTLIALATAEGEYVETSTNGNYDTYIPKYMGSVIYMEKKLGKVIVPEATMDRYFPGWRSQFKPAAQRQELCIGTTRLIIVGN